MHRPTVCEHERLFGKRSEHLLILYTIYQDETNQRANARRGSQAPSTRPVRTPDSQPYWYQQVYSNVGNAVHTDLAVAESGTENRLAPTMQLGPTD